MDEESQTVLTAFLQKNEGDASFGFGVSQIPNQPMLVVKNVKENTPAYRAGLKAGDVLLAVNDVSVAGKSVKDVGGLIMQATNGQLRVAYSRGGDAIDESNKENESLKQSQQPSDIYRQMSPDQSTVMTTTTTTGPPPTQPHPISIHHLKKWQGVTGFGFSIQQKSDGSKIIVKIEQNTPAFASGIRLEAVLCQVNSTNVQNITYPDTVALIKASGSEVSLTVATRETIEWLRNNNMNLDENMSSLIVHTHEPPPEPPVSEPPAPETEATLTSSITTQSTTSQSLQATTRSSIQNQSAPEDVYGQPKNQLSDQYDDVYGIAQKSAAPVIFTTGNTEQTISEVAVASSSRLSAASTTIYRCRITKTPEIRGYGFGLKNEQGQVTVLRISKVDDNSPAFEAGLEVGMVVVKINGSMVFNKTVAEVKPLIAANPDEVEFIAAPASTFAEALQTYGSDLETAANSFTIQDRERKTIEDNSRTDFGTLTLGTSLALSYQPPSMPVQELQSWPSELPLPRNCQLSKWPSKFKGYGFHLQAERNKAGHYIGKLDAGSPAEHGGLMINWRIVAVNDSNILTEPHASVVQKIQQSGDNVCLLIATNEAVTYSEQRGITISKDMKECKVQHFQTPLNPPENLEVTTSAGIDNSLNVSLRQEQSQQLTGPVSAVQQPVERISAAATPQKPTDSISVVATPQQPADRISAVASPQQPADRISAIATSQQPSPAPPTPPSPLPLSPAPTENRQPSEDADLAYLRAVKEKMGTRRLKDPRRQRDPNQTKLAFETANML